MNESGLDNIDLLLNIMMKRNNIKIISSTV